MITRTFDAEMRTETDDDMRLVTGHASVSNQFALIGTPNWGFMERVAPGAFTDVLSDDVRFLVNHGGLPMARTTNGTLRLSEDTVGLAVEAELARTHGAQDLIVLLDRGDVNQMSFAFSIAEEEWTTYEDVSNPDLDGLDARTITKIKRLYDVSAVTYPAYEGTDVGVRNLYAPEEEIDMALKRAASAAKELRDPQGASSKAYDQAQRLLCLYKLRN